MKESAPVDRTNLDIVILITYVPTVEGRPECCWAKITRPKRTKEHADVVSPQKQSGTGAVSALGCADTLCITKGPHAGAQYP